MRRDWFCRWETSQLIPTFEENLNFGCGELEPSSKYLTMLTVLTSCKSPVTGAPPAKCGSRSVVLMNRPWHWLMEMNQRSLKRFRFSKVSARVPPPRWCGNLYVQPESVAFLAVHAPAQRKIPPVSLAGKWRSWL